MKKIAIIQSNYIPWKGYFDIINYVDTFVLYDDAQYTKRDWRNRNKIKVPDGTLWLTIPIEVKGKYYQKIKEAKIADKDWNKKHWKTITFFYAKAPYFNEYREIFEQLYLDKMPEYLSLINYKFITAINKILGITTPIRWSWEFEIKGNKSEKLLNICKQLNAQVYVSGPSAKNYLDINLFKQENISIEWFDYQNYTEYKQLFSPPFIHNVSIIDLIFNTGKNAPKYMKTFSQKD